MNATEAAVSALPVTEVLVFDGVDDLDPVAPLEILGAAGFPTRVVRPAGHARAVHTVHGLTLDVPDELSSAAGLVIVPGGGWRDPGGGVRALRDGPLPARLAALHAGGAVLASVCTGAMLLSAAGLLAGRPAVTNRIALDDLALEGAIVHRDARVVDDGDLVTCGGPSAGLDIGVHLVGRYLGAAAGAAAAARLEYVPVGPVLVVGGGAARAV